MDAGVPVSAPVAGIAMGLIKEGDRFAVLTDILGDEDHFGERPSHHPHFSNMCVQFFCAIPARPRLESFDRYVELVTQNNA